jgi:glutathionyl-hydroquinone reductase
MTSTSPGQLTAEMRDGRFVRQANAFTDRITADGSSGYRAEPGRYHL